MVDEEKKVLTLVPKEEKPSQAMIESIEKMLARAKAGELAFVAWVEQRSDTKTNFMVIHDAEVRSKWRDRFSLLGGIHYLAHMLEQSIDKAD